VRNLENASGEVASVFGHVQRRVTDQNFEQIKVVAVFGGYELDLREAGIKGDQAYVEAAAVFGGIEIIVPEDWLVIPRGAGVFGGFTDETSAPQQPTKRLIVKGAGVFGGVIITNNRGFWSRHHERMQDRMAERQQRMQERMEERRQRFQERWERKWGGRHWQDRD
jgi:hypothetical protein